MNRKFLKSIATINRSRNGFQVRRAHVGTTLRGKSHPVDRDDVSDILRDGKCAGDVDVIIVSAQDEVLAEVKVLLLAVTGDRLGESHPQAAPALRTFLPGRDLRDFEAGHHHEERRREIGPHRIPVEVGPIQRIPGRKDVVSVE